MARAVLVALLVACSLVGTAAGGAPALQPSQTAQVDDDGPADVEMLGLDSPTRSDVTTQGVDVSTAVSMQRESAVAGIDRRALEVAFARAEDEQARRELLFEAATDVEIAISALHSERRDLRSDYLNGTITAEDYARSRAKTTVRVERLQGDIELIRELSNRVPQLSMRSRLEALEVSLTGTSGPVTERVGATMTGEQPSFEAYLAVSGNGRVLAMVSDGEYVREAYRSDVWTPDTTSGIGFAQAEGRMGELYPVAFNSSWNLGTGMVEHGAGTYRITMEVREGNVVTYLDGDTQNVFFEVQRFRLASIEPGPSVSASDNGTRLAVNRTHDGGPLRIATFDNSTGTPTDVPVFVDGREYRTGSGGVVWVVDPEGSTRVVATAEGGNVSLTVVPRSPSLVNVSAVEE